MSKIVRSILLPFCFGTILFILGCNKEQHPDEIDTTNLLRVFPKDKNQVCFSINPTYDHGFLMFSSSDLLIENDAFAMNISKINTEGDMEWTTSFTDTIYEPRVTELKDGSFLVSSSFYAANLLKIDKNGQLVFKTRYTKGFTSDNYFSYPIEAENGNFYVAQCNISPDSSEVVVRGYSKDGQYQSLREFPYPIFGGMIYYLTIQRFEEPETYYLSGLVLLDPWAFRNNPRLFVARLEYNNSVLTSKKITILDPDNIKNSNQPFYKFNTFYKTLFTADKNWVISTYQIGPEGKKGHVIKVDQNLKKLWDLDLIFGSKGTIPESISQCIDGNYLICGICWVDGKYLEQPFACKVSPNGNIIWTKIYTTALNGAFNSGFQLPDKSYIFGGTTNGFGNGSNQKDVFIMKTDKDGNVK